MAPMDQTRGQKPGHPLPVADRVPAVEEHGRVLTTNPWAAAWYRQAQRAADCRAATTALEGAVAADPAFGIAIADLSAITATSTGDPKGRQMPWERHHIEVVRSASTGGALRTADLLLEHLANVGCDPLASRIVAHLRWPMEDLAGRPPSCHPLTWARRGD